MTTNDIPHVTYISGKKTNLRPINPSDINHIFKYVNDREIMQFMGTRTPLSYQAEIDWIERVSKPNEHNIVFAVETKEKDFLGTMGLHNIDLQNGLATTGALFGNKELLGKGYGTDAKIVMLLWAFNQFPIRKISSSVYGPNKRSRRYLEKTGYKQEGRFRDHLFINGSYVDEYKMAVFREDFLEEFGAYMK